METPTTIKPDEEGSPAAAHPARRRSSVLLRFLGAATALALVSWVAALWLQGVGIKAMLPPLPTIDPPDGAMAEQIRAADAAARRRLPSASRVGQLGQVYHANLFSEEALACYALAERLDAKDYRWPYYAGLITYDTGLQERACEHFTRSLQHARSAPWVHLRRADTRLKLNQLAEADADYEQAAGVPAFRHEALVGLARVAERRQAWKEAIELLRGALNEFPASGPCRRLLAGIYRQTGQSDEAEELLSPQHTIFPFVPFDDPLIRELEKLSCSSTFLLKQATLAYRRQNPRHAGELLHRLVNVVPADPDGHASLAEWARGEALEATGRGNARATQSLVSLALREARIAIDLAPNVARAHITLGATLEATGNAAAAIEAYLLALEAEPDLAEAHRRLGVALSTVKRFGKAEEHCRKALRLEPMNPSSLDRLGYVLAQAGKWEAAISFWQRSGELDPTSPAPLFNIARGLVTLGRKDEAKDILERLLGRFPDMQLATDLLAQLQGKGAVPTP